MTLEPGPLPKVRAVVLNYNGGEHVLRCVEALLATDYPADRFEVVVVDNASSDGSDAALARRFPDVRLVPTGANLGFPANNVAMTDLARDGIDAVALVNNDAFVAPGWLRPLVDVLVADPRVGAACPKIVFAPRFVEVVVRSPTFDPPGDARRLGVQLLALNGADQSLFGLSQYVKDAWGAEPREGGWFRWLGAEAVIRVALPDGPAPAPAPRTPGAVAVPTFLELQVAAEREKRIEIESGRYRASASVGPEPRWIRVPVVPDDAFDVINNAGSVLIEDGYGADRGYLQIDDGSFDEPCDVFNWCGGGVLLRREYLEDAGLFDERFFLYYEDTDLSWRGRGLGWRYRYVPGSVVRHLHAASSGEGSDLFQFYVERNRLLMLTKNAPRRLVVHALVEFLADMVSYVRRSVLPPLRQRRRPPLHHLRLRLRSLRSYLRLAPAMVADRRALRRRRLRNDAELATGFTARPWWTAADERIRATAGRRTGRAWWPDGGDAPDRAAPGEVAA